MGTDTGTIIVVEDDPNIADLVDMYLRREGFRVLQAGDGAAGWEIVSRERPRLVILDVGLPGEVDGLELCRRMRAAPGRAGLPVLMLTARDGEVDRVLAWSWAPTTTSPSPSLPVSWWPGSRPSSGARKGSAKSRM
jgi:DNA-binding response OmpR family regulator